MKGTAEFHQDAQHYYEACFGPESDRAKRYETILKAEEEGDYDAVDELREEEAESVLSVEQLTHSFRGNCEWEILVTSGGPAARVLVEVDVNGEVKWAEFQLPGLAPGVVCAGRPEPSDARRLGGSELPAGVPILRTGERSLVAPATPPPASGWIGCRQDSSMVWNPDELDDRARALAHACLDHWTDDANGGTPPDRLRDSIQSVENAPDDAELRRFLL